MVVFDAGGRGLARRCIRALQGALKIPLTVHVEFAGEPVYTVGGNTWYFSLHPWFGP